MNTHQKQFYQFKTAQAATAIAKLAYDKAKKELKTDHTNDKKRFKLQDAIGRLNRTEKSVWMKHSHLPK